LFAIIYCSKWPIRQFVVVITALLLSLLSGPGTAGVVELILGAERYQIELATTPLQRQQGLMHRSALAQRRGMLLVYPQAGDHRIWMKNMLIPLRVYWIDANFNVIDMQRLEPCSALPCPVYAVEDDSRYVLELGDYEHPLEPGDRIEGLRGL
jgi:hypothetical protein